MEDLYSLFMRGHNLLLEQRHDEAFNIFQEIVNGKDIRYHSGAYVNMAKCLIEKAVFEEGEGRLQDKQKEQIIKSYLDNALYYKPSNQAALAMYFYFCFTYRKYKEAVHYFLKFESRDLVDHWMPFLLMLRNEKNEEVIHALEEVFKKYPNYTELGAVIGIMYMNTEDYPNAYYHFRKMKEYNNEDLNALINLGLVCNVLKKPTDAENYCLEALDVIGKLSRSAKDKELIDDFKEKATSNLCLSYLNQHKYEQARDLLIPKLKVNPNNTDYHNLSFVYYKMKNYKESLLNSEKALFISEDETTYFLIAENKFALGEYEESIYWYKNTIQFLESGVTSFIFEDPKESLSSSLVDIEEIFQRAYIAIIQAYIECKDVVNATAYYKIAEDKWKYNDELFKLHKLIKTFKVMEEENEEVKNNIKSLKNEWEQNKLSLESKVNQVKNWAISLLKLQNRCDDFLNFNSEEDWKVIERQMHEIAQHMIKEEDLNSSMDYMDINKNFKNKYPNLHEKSLSFLSTGEYLLKVHENDFIDYAPIMIEFCKVVETELNIVLKLTNVINKKRDHTLGQILVELEKKNPFGWIKFLPILREILNYRNGSAHTGKSTREKVIRIRSIIFEEKWLEFILGWKVQPQKK